MFPARFRVEGYDVEDLTTGWEAANSAPDVRGKVTGLEELEWLPARVPGTAARVLADAGRWRPGEPSDFDSRDWWFRCRFDAAIASAEEEVVLATDGIATVAEVYLNGNLIHEGDSMFGLHELDIGARLRGDNELVIRCRALAPLLQERRRPRARWRTRLVADGNLRFFRTSLLGRAPGFAAGPAPVGPWRPLRLERRRHLAAEQLELRSRLDGAAGVVSLRVRLRAIAGELPTRARLELSGPSGNHRAELELNEGAGVGELVVPGAERWWPHTHGAPALHDVRLVLETAGGPSEVELGRVGFRTLNPGPTPEHSVEEDGLDLHLNGVRVFARGALWTPVDFTGLAPTEKELRTAIERARAGGLNMLRLAGTGAYESDLFHDLCDELGMLVWQDFMFANLDYPIGDPSFRATVEREAGNELERIGGRPSLAVLCGNSEVEQQVAMLGLDPELGRGELFGELLPALVASANVDVPYLPSAPCGGTLPFRTDRGVANYFGVGGYMRPIEDARRAEVRFASECLAISNVPDESGIEASAVVHHPRWKAGVPRDAGAGWDFEDVRDHYLRLLFDVDPVALRRVDHARYLELSRAVSGEVMAEVFGEWRRAGSPCGGALVLWLRDLVPGAGWGLVDSQGNPKVAYHHLRRALAPTAVWTTDEGLGGIAVHVANDGGEPLSAALRIALYRDREQQADAATVAVELEAHGLRSFDLEAVLGRFVDVAWSYRFGAPAHDVVVASLERDGCTLSQGFRFPAGRPLTTEAAGRLGLSATGRMLPDGRVRLVVRSLRLAYGVRIHVEGYDADDNAFSVEPGGERSVLLRPLDSASKYDGGALTALNLQGRIRIDSEATT